MESDLAKPKAVEIAMRMPVKDPGPLPTAISSRSLRVHPIRMSRKSIDISKLMEWV
jgi:hypothetical protein